ncbi:MAG: hypothetical protein AB7U45_04140 [Desulfamplus sp.]
MKETNSEEVNVEPSPVYHIEISDNVSGLRILNNILSNKDRRHIKKNSWFDDVFYIRDRYLRCSNNDEGSYCVLFYSLDGKLHCISNDYLYAHCLLIEFVFNGNSRFSTDDFKINGYWDSDYVKIDKLFRRICNILK